MPVSIEFLERAAGATGFAIGALEKVVRLGELAADVARHPLLGTGLALKGGSALNLCWGVPTRLSVDLDYNVIGHPDRAATLAARPAVEAAVEELGRRRGYLVQRSPETFAGRKVYLGFTSVSGAPDRIEVDLNFVFRTPVGSPEVRRLWQPGGLDHQPALVVSLDELCIGKLLALLDRGAARDAWDAGRLPDLAGVATIAPRFRALFIALAATLDHPLASYSKERLAARVDERTVREQLAPMLMAGRSPDATDLVERAWAVVGPLLQLTAAEAAFMEAIARGEFRPELLGDAAALSLNGHPAIEWKLKNVREHRPRTRR